MANKSLSNPIGFAASVPGAGHIRYGTPCQDASGVTLAPRPAAIVCDGRGSAKLSHFGAQGAVKGFFSQLNVLEPFLAGALDCDASPEKWDGLCRLFYRTLMQVKLDLAAERSVEEKEFDFTVAFAVAGRKSIGCFQVGDGAIVLRQDGVCQTAFDPDKGEFANQTQFLRSGGEDAGKYHAAIFPAAGNTGIAITSDGPEYLMFRQPDMEPGPIFGQMLDDLSKDELCEQDLRDYLTRSVWATDPRGADDRSIAVLMPNAAHAPVKTTPPPQAKEKPAPQAKEKPAPQEKSSSKNDNSHIKQDTEPAAQAGSNSPSRSPWLWLFLLSLIAVFGLIIDKYLNDKVPNSQKEPATITPVAQVEAFVAMSNITAAVDTPATTNAVPTVSE